MKRDEVLLWLNDRLGKSLNVSIEVAAGDVSFAVLSAGGELRHWTQGTPAALHTPARDELDGFYRVGAAVLDLSNVDPVDVKRTLDDHLTVRLDERTTLEIIEHADEP